MAAKREISGHVIVCGYGVVGQKVTDVLLERGIRFIVIDMDPKKIELMRQLGVDAIEGDATHSRVLKEAYVDTARAIAIVLDDDAKNLFSVLTARDMNKKIFITARANDEFVREKLIEAGADYVVMPQKVASKEILKELTKGSA
ncbi:MAG TPA: NAD(P)-binding protein [Candidatus Acidoferrales bacterium]|nr:NAD(P)-binding protein [Candidatus Acidoferrales bacterium]